MYQKRLLMIEDEKRAQQISLDKLSAEAARVSQSLPRQKPASRPHKAAFAMWKEISLN